MRTENRVKFPKYNSLQLFYCMETIPKCIIYMEINTKPFKNIKLGQICCLYTVNVAYMKPYVV